MTNKHLSQKFFALTKQLQACYVIEQLILIFNINDTFLLEKLSMSRQT